MIWQVERKQGIPKQDKSQTNKGIKARQERSTHENKLCWRWGKGIDLAFRSKDKDTCTQKALVKSFPTICCDPYSYPINTNKTQREQDKPRQHKTRTNKTRVRERRHDRQDMQQPVVGPLLISDQSLTTTKAQKIVFFCDGPKKKKSLVCISLWPNN